MDCVHLNPMLESKGKEPYRGVAIFGMSGSGKTSTANLLGELDPRFVVLEASTDIIRPLNHIAQLPNDVPDLLPFVLEAQHASPKKAIPFEEDYRFSARDTFNRLSYKYGRNWVAKLIDVLRETVYSDKMIIVAGMRGFENAQLLIQLDYLTVFLTGSAEVFARRQADRDDTQIYKINLDQEIEEQIYQTQRVEQIAHLVIDTTYRSVSEVASRILDIIRYKECAKCVNNTMNPSVTLDEDMLCSVCRMFEANYNTEHLQAELAHIKTFIKSGMKKHDVLVGMSGGKDSSATVYLVKQMGFTPLGFTFDIGYYPDHIFSRAEEVAKILQIDHEIIDIRKYISPSSIESYKMTAKLYDVEESEEASQVFRYLYAEGRRHYSVKDDTPRPYVRTCQLCRKTVIPGYYWEALKHGVRLVVLGINEWTRLSQNTQSDKCIISGIRRLQPFADRPAVYVAHLPFILQMTRAKVEAILKEIGWQLPPGENLIESNSNSCLFARAAESKACRLLGFHPDTTRLAREVTVGFIDKADAMDALCKKHPFSKSVRQVLEDAKLIEPL